jgi:hypothetical protein
LNAFVFGSTISMFEHKKYIFFTYNIHFAAPWTSSTTQKHQPPPPPPPHNSQLHTCLKVHSTKICVLDDIRKGHRTEKKVLQAISNIMHSSSLVTSDTLTPVNHVCQCGYGHNLMWKLTQDPVLKKMMMPSKCTGLG